MGYRFIMDALALAALVAVTFSTALAASDAPAVEPDPQAFMQAAATANQLEIDLGRLAQTRSARDDVKELAAAIVKDQTATGHELHALARTKSMQVSASPDSKERAVYERVADLTGEAFDRAYLRKTLSDQERAVAEFRLASRSSDDADVRAWAARTLTTLETDLDHARRVASGEQQSGAPSDEPRAEDGQETTPRN